MSAAKDVGLRVKNRFIDIRYFERDDLSAYTGVSVSEIGNDEVHVFNSGDVVKDFSDMRKWCAENPIDGRYMLLSSVDHFCSDVPGYKWVVDKGGFETIATMSEEEAREQMLEMEADRLSESTAH